MKDPRHQVKDETRLVNGGGHGDADLAHWPHARPRFNSVTAAGLW
jgi:hypothetical protein